MLPHGVVTEVVWFDCDTASYRLPPDTDKPPSHSTEIAP